MQHRGRLEIFTDEYEITSANVIDVLQKALGTHLVNVSDINELIEYEKGDQPIHGREKQSRKEINHKIVDNVAAEVTDFWIAFAWGNPITLGQRGNRWDNPEEEAKAINLLNECYTATNNDTDTLKLARFIEICGVGYTFIDINIDYEDGESYFTRDVLDPQNAFVVRSSVYPDRRVMLGVSFRKDKEGNYRFTAFTKDTRFEISAMKVINGKPVSNPNDDEGRYWSERQRSGEKNPLGKIPIIEWVRSYDRMGVFEKQMDELDNLNVLVSDFTNDVDQNTNAIIHTNDIEPPLVEVEKEVLKDDGTVEIIKDVVERKYQPGEWVRTYTTQDGNKPIIEAITSDYDYSGMLSNILARRNLILQKCHVPITTDKTNGATGVAMDAATGWSDAETIASAQELITNGCYIEEVRVVLCAIRESVDLAQDSILRNLRACDVKPNVRRPKTYEMSIKVNSMATLIKTGFAVEDVVGTIPLFDDPSSVILTSGDGVRKYQETIFTQNEQSEGEGEESRKDVQSDKTMADMSEQIQNSPNLDGQQKQLEVE
jgi:SPP1 family phage portal protein